MNPLFELRERSQHFYEDFPRGRYPEVEAKPNAGGNFRRFPLRVGIDSDLGWNSRFFLSHRSPCPKKGKAIYLDNLYGHLSGQR